VQSNHEEESVIEGWLLAIYPGKYSAYEMKNPQSLDYI